MNYDKEIMKLFHNERILLKTKLILISMHKCISV